MLTIIFFLKPIPVNADIAAPEIPQQGGNIYTTNTKVSMEAEKVVITYKPDKTKAGYQELATADVVAIFTMKNNSNQDESIKIYFPVDNSFFLKGEMPLHDSIYNFKVDGQTLSKQSLSDVDYKGKPLQSFVWDETFPANQEKTISIKYTTNIADLSYGIYSRVDSVTYVIGTGSTWYGSIGKGEITFVLPITLHDYSFPEDIYVGGLVLGGAGTLKPTVKDNTVTYNFENYEPASDEIIDLQTYHLDILKTIESQKAKFQDIYEDNLKLGDLFSTLSVGPHCVYCSNPAADIAKNYYNSALAKATSKTQVIDVVDSYFKPNLSLDKNKSLEQNFEDTINFNNCGELEEMECKYNIYGMYIDGGFFDVPVDSKIGDNKPFMLVAADKMRNYDPTFADAMVSFVNNYASVKVKQSYEQSQNQPKQQSSQNARQVSSTSQSSTKVNPILVLLSLLVLFCLGGMAYLIRFKPEIFNYIKSRLRLSKEKLSIDSQQNVEDAQNESKSE